MIRVALFASGTGTNAMKLLEAARELHHIEIALVLVDQAKSQLPQRMKNENPRHTYRVKVIERTGTREQHEAQITEALVDAKIDWVFLAGYMRILSSEMTKKFRFINIHPSLLPLYAGLDAYERAFANGDAESGITIHHVDSGVDTGPVIVQEKFPRLTTDTLDSFMDRGKALEWTLYPQVLKKLNDEGTL